MVDYLFDPKNWDKILKLGGLIVLILVALFLLTWSGMVPCRSLTPYWCDAYDTVMGGPRVLIVFGDGGGLGDPMKLQELLRDPQYVGAGTVDVQHVDRISLGNLKKYKLVIVEQAKLLSADQLQMFNDYVTTYGGRLVWVADAGTERPADEYAGLIDQNSGKLVYNNAWARVKDDPDNAANYLVVPFDELLGLRYVGNYCSEVNCVDTPFSVGRMESESTGDNPLIFGTSPSLNLNITKSHDFSIVKQIPNSPNSDIVLTLNTGGARTGKDANIAKAIPFITTATVGAPGAERVAYYAYPPEWFAQDNNYFSYIKNMYFGMLGR